MRCDAVRQANLAGLAELYVELQLLRKGLQHELAQPQSAEASAALESKLAQVEAALARRAEQVRRNIQRPAQGCQLVWAGAAYMPVVPVRQEDACGS
jgi:hypothetical protein